MGKSLTAVHPGEVVRQEVLNALELSVGEAATALGVTRTALSALLNGRASLSPEMAIRIEKAFGLEMERLLHLQTDWDVAQAKSRAGDIAVLAYRPVQKARRQGELFRAGIIAADEPRVRTATPARRPA